MDIDEITAYKNEDGTFSLSVFGMDEGKPCEVKFERLRLTMDLDVIAGVKFLFEQCEKPEFFI